MPEDSRVSNAEIRTWVYDGLVNEILMRVIRVTYPQLILDAQRVAEDHLKGTTSAQLRWAAMMKMKVNTEYGAMERLRPICGGEGELLDWLLFAKKNGIRGDERI